MASVTRDVDLQLKSVLLATDFSEASEKALRHALAVVRHYRAKFHLMHVVSSLGFTLVGPDALAAATAAATRDAYELESDLVRSGALNGVTHDVTIRQGGVWEELEKVIQQEKIDMVVIGTHGRRGLGKLILGSVAEQIFRHADCLVLTVGPGSLQEAPIEGRRPIRPFLFPTDFSEASLHALPTAISFSNHFATQLVLLHVIQTVTMSEDIHWPTADDLIQAREAARNAALTRLEKLASHHPELLIKPKFAVEFGTPSEKILQTGGTFKADAIILGLHRSAHVGAASHMPWATAYEVVCGAGCAVLTVRS